jgi:osmotically-inducible protein OsmY
MIRLIALITLLLALPGCNRLIASATDKPLGITNGERSLATRLQDSGIERTINVNVIKADPRFRDANVNVLSFYGNVLLVGQVQNEELKAKVEKIAKEIEEVKQIHNELTIGEASYYGERLSDGSITKKIESSFVFEKGFPSSRTKVITVAGTVYLMGKLTPSESEKAVTIISQTSGVKKLVKLVDALPEPKVESAPADNPIL